MLRTCVIKKVTFKEVVECDKSDFSYYKELLIKKRIRSLWEQILSFKRSSHFEKGRNRRESLFDPVASLYVRNYFGILATILVLKQLGGYTKASGSSTTTKHGENYFTLLVQHDE